MKAVNKIPKWMWVSGGIAAILVIILAYERSKVNNEIADPCDPNDPHYDPSVCNAPAPTDTSQYPAQQMAMPSGAAGGFNYYLPLGYGQGQTIAKGAEDATPESLENVLPESEEQAPEESGLNAFDALMGQIHPTAPGVPVTGSTPSEGLFGAIKAPLGEGASGEIGGQYVGIAPAQPAPAPGPSVGPGHPAPAPIAVAPAVPAPGGWCGHPNAVGVGQPCSYKDSHNPPAGWHWFCCNGMLGRAPN